MDVQRFSVRSVSVWTGNTAKQAWKRGASANSPKRDRSCRGFCADGAPVCLEIMLQLFWSQLAVGRAVCSSERNNVYGSRRVEWFRLQDEPPVTQWTLTCDMSISIGRPPNPFSTSMYILCCFFGSKKSLEGLPIHIHTFVICLNPFFMALSFVVCGENKREHRHWIMCLPVCQH